MYFEDQVLTKNKEKLNEELNAEQPPMRTDMNLC